MANRRRGERGKSFDIEPAQVLHRWLSPEPVLTRSRRALQRAIAQLLWDRHRPWRYLGTRWIQVTFRLKGNTARTTICPTLASGEGELRRIIAEHGEIVAWEARSVTRPPPETPPPEHHGASQEAILRRIQRDWNAIEPLCDKK